MKTDDEMPGNDRDDAESDISDNQEQLANKEQEGQSEQSPRSLSDL